VNDAEGVLKQHHSQPPEHPLQDDGDERGQPAPAQPFWARITTGPEPACAEGSQARQPEDQAIRPSARRNHACRGAHQEKEQSTPAHEGAGVSAVEPQSEYDRQQADPGGGEAMGMLVEDSAYPVRDREEEHVIPAGIGPIRHGHAGAVAGHQAARAQQGQRGRGGQHGEAMQIYAGNHFG
jgi:hypothetical protein